MGEPHQPFSKADWTAEPTDEQLVEAIVGRGGTSEERDDAREIARGLLVPYLRERTGIEASLRWKYESLAGDYDHSSTYWREDVLLRMAVGKEVQRISQLASQLARARLGRALFTPAAFVGSDAWSKAARIDPVSIPAKAARLDARLRELEQKYRHRLPEILGGGDVDVNDVAFGEYRRVELARNAVHVAVTGDYEVTSGEIHDFLVRHRIRTSIHPLQTPL